MRSKFFVFILFSLMFMPMLDACAPLAIAEASGEQPTPRVETIPTVGYQPVAVDHVEVEVGVGSPIPVQVIATGSLPDTCAQIELVRQKQDGSLFWQGVLVVPNGFVPPMGQACSEPVEVPVVDGRASYNGISFKIDPSLNFGLTGRICSASTVEEQPMSNESHPPYTEFFFSTYSRGNVDYQPHIRVYEVTGDLENYLFPINSLDELRTTLEQRSQPVTWFQHSPLHSRQAYLDFGNGAGVRGLVEYMQDYFFYTNNSLLYEFQGLTQDRRHFVSVRYPVSVPFLMELKGITLPPDNINPTAITIPAWPGDYEQQRKVIEAYNAEALQRFEQISDSEVFPSLALLDELVQSIQISQP